MGHESIDLDKARSILNLAWEKIDNEEARPPSNAAQLIEMVLTSDNVTFKYILVTGLLGKCTNRLVHPRALQTGSKLVNSYDARSLCHKVVVTFEKDKGDLWGLSNEPFVNKPARHPEHDKSNRQLRDKELAAATHDALEIANTASVAEVFAMLILACRLGRRRADSQVVAEFEKEATYVRVLRFVEVFLKETDGGARLAAVVGAFVRLLNQESKVKIYPPNYSDTFARTSGDVEIHKDNAILSAFECKHRPISIDDIKHGLRKAKENGVAEYCFIYAEGIVSGQSKEIQTEIDSNLELIDVQLFDIRELLKPWVTALNPLRRGQFGQVVSEILRSEMRRSEVANQSAAIWNESFAKKTDDDRG
jgi:hypothetical protein